MDISRGRTGELAVAAALLATVLSPVSAVANTPTTPVPGLTSSMGALADPVLVPDGIGLVDPTKGLWHLRNGYGDPAVFYFGNPGDFPFVGDWDCDGDATPGLYRQSNGYAYLRNTNTAGVADITFFFGNPGDVPIAGDFDNDGCDTVSIYRPSQQRFYIINELGVNGGGLGAADYWFAFGNPGDQPFAGDFDGDGFDEVGLHRATTGLVYFEDALLPNQGGGAADHQFFFGNPGDRFIAGDWGIVDGTETPAIFRPSSTTMYLRHTNTQGNADSFFSWGASPWLPVSGNFGVLTSGVTVSLTNTPPTDVGYAVESLYLELPRAPELPSGLRENLAGLSSDPKSLNLSGVYTGAAAFGGHVGVVTIADDVILLASNDGVDWRVVGTHMVRYDRNRWFGGSPRFVVAIGSDEAGNPNPLYSYADSVHIISLVPAPTATPTVAAGAIVGVPRDTVVHVPYASGGTVGYCTGMCDQINHSSLDKGGGLPKGPAVTVEALELETGIPIEGYFHTSFGTNLGDAPGFQDLVDAFIAAYSAFSFLVPYDVPGASAGQETVDGDDALSFARHRATRPRGDHDRTLAQGLLIKAAIANVQPFGLQSTPGLLAILDDYVITDLTVDQVLTFAATVFFLDPGSMPTLAALDLTNLKEAAYDLNPGSIPNVVLSGCNYYPTPAEQPTTSTFSGSLPGSFAYWLNANNRTTIADLSDGTLSSTPIPCLTFP